MQIRNLIYTLFFTFCNCIPAVALNLWQSFVAQKGNKPFVTKNKTQTN